ncbi:MAG: hypothetical protein GY820_38540 [Gammaproteobacteria bacterium]|nr:hypothetical protein [Gammaproteobacteria bacterium]
MKTKEQLHNKFNTWVWNECNGKFETACEKLGIELNASNISTWPGLYNIWVERIQRKESTKAL